MSRRPLTLRSAVLVGASLLAGSAAGNTGDILLAHLSITQASGTQAVACIVSLWTMDKLNRLIDDDK